MSILYPFGRLRDRVDRNEVNTGLLALKTAIDRGWTVFDMAGGFADEFHDEAGIDAAVSSRQAYDAASNFYGVAAASAVDAAQQDGAAEPLTAGLGSAVEDSYPGSGVTIAPVGGEGCARFSSVSPGHAQIKIPMTAGFGAPFMAEADVYLGAPNFPGTGPHRAHEWWWTLGGNTYAIMFSYEGLVVRDASVARVSAATGVYQDYTWTRLSVHVKEVIVAPGEGVNGCSAVFDVYNGGSLVASDLKTYGYGAPADTPDEWVLRSQADGTSRTDGIKAAQVSHSFVFPAFSLVSAAFDPGFQPGAARAVILAGPALGAALNVDYVAELSRDGGVSWSPAELTKEADFSAEIEVWATAEADLAAQPAGQDFRLRLRAPGGAAVDVHAWYGQAR